MRPRARPLIHIFSALTALLYLASCTPDDPTQPVVAIHQSYEMEYEVARDRTTGRASLRINNAAGALHQLGPPASMLYNGIGMTWSGSEPFPYARIESGRLPSGQFEYTDANGIVRTNIATLSSVEAIALPSGVNELTIGFETTIVWQGAALSTGETVSLIFNTPANGVAVFYQQTLGATSITLSPTDIAQLGVGSATWRLERVRYVGLQASTSGGGQIGIRWSTGDRPLTIK